MNTYRLLPFLLAICVATPVFAAKDLVQRRKERIEFAEEQWSSPEKVTLNVHYRVPVIEVLGYLAANYDDPQRLNTIASKLRPIANRVKELAGDTYEGRTFPAGLKAETERMRTQMMNDVTAVYGSKVTQTVESYLERKYSSLDTGIFSPFN